MTLADDVNIDEETNRMINEFLHQDKQKNPSEINFKGRTLIDQRQHSFIQSKVNPISSSTIVQQDNPLTVSSPSIIVTGYDSSST